MLSNSRQRPSRSHCCDKADLKKATAIREKQATAFSAEEKDMQGGASMMQIKTPRLLASSRGCAAIVRRDRLASSVEKESATVEDLTLQIEDLSGVIAAMEQTWRREAGNGILR